MPEKIVVLTGSGVASSVGLGGLSGVMDSVASDPHYSKVLSASEYGNYLEDFWQFAKERALEAMKTKPGLVHSSIAEKGWPVITQNIGGVHWRAGSETIEIYGTLFAARCLRCQHETPLSAKDYKKMPEGFIPSCEKCGKNRTRPDICLPGEGMRHRKQAEHLLSDANTIIYVGVDPHSGPSTEWYHKVPASTLVSETTWGNFNTYYTMTPVEWAKLDCPAHKIAI